MKTTFIYALKDPSTKDIRYVGKSDDPKYRFSKHLQSAKRKKTYKSCWIFSLLSRGETPELEIIDEVPYQYWPMLEAAYIEFFKECGCNLVNSSPGGEGVTFTSDVRCKMSKAMEGNTRWSGKTLSDEHRRKISISKKNISNYTREKMRKSQSIRMERERQDRILDEMWV